jgi:hypothetical protein
VHVCTGVSTQRTENNTSRINETEGNEELADTGFRKKRHILKHPKRCKKKHGTPQIRITQLTQKNKKNAVGEPA